jgi:acyl-CoA thioesterase-1
MWAMRPIAILLIVLGLAAGASAIEPEPIRIVAYGDSNTAGFGVSDADSYPRQLEQALQARGYRVEVRNAGVSGDTTGRALRRFDEAFPEGTHIAIVFLGRNDMRFGVPRAQTEQNLHEIVGRLRARGIEVILAGFYTRNFINVAQAHGAVYYPDFFEGVAVQGVKQSRYTLFWDIIGHLNGQGYREIVTRITPLVEAHVLMLFCMRLAEAVMFAPQCQTFDAWAGITNVATGSIPRR